MQAHRTNGSYRSVEIIKRNKRKLPKCSNQRTGVPSPVSLLRSVINHETSRSRALQRRLSEPLALSALSGRLDLVVLFAHVLFRVMATRPKRLRLIYSFFPPSFIWVVHGTSTNGVTSCPCLDDVRDARGREVGEEVRRRNAA